LEGARKPTTTALLPSPLASRPIASHHALTPPQHRRSSTLAAAADQPKMYTTSFAFFEALWDAGVTHVFVNLGSDHPSIIEAMVKGAREKKGQFPRIITCPNEVRLNHLSFSFFFSLAFPR
jgi:hypothetical protein